VRDFINERAHILGLVSLPQAAFKRPASKGSGDTGSGVKASLLFLRKKKEAGAEMPYLWPSRNLLADATGRPDKDEFQISKAWKNSEKQPHSFR
jgi:hypothetical protein